VQEYIRCFRGAGHIRAFADRYTAILGERLCACLIKLVLRRAGQRDIALDVPYTGATLGVFGLFVI
jgi:hypothetical protein